MSVLATADDLKHFADVLGLSVLPKERSERPILVVVNGGRLVFDEPRLDRLEESPPDCNGHTDVEVIGGGTRDLVDDVVAVTAFATTFLTHWPYYRLHRVQKSTIIFPNEFVQLHGFLMRLSANHQKAAELGCKKRRRIRQLAYTCIHTELGHRSTYTNQDVKRFSPQVV